MTSCDSVLSPLNMAMSTKTYRQLLATIDSELYAENINNLKFLCEPYLGMKKASVKISTGIEIFDALERNSKLSEDKLFYLCELLYLIGRVDLAMKIDPDCSSSCTKPRHVDPFRVMLFNLSEQLATEDLSRLRYLYEKVPKRVTINDGIDLFSVMIQQNSISPTKVGLLEDLLLDIDRHDLIGEITSFCQRSLSGHQEPTNYSYTEVEPVLESTWSMNYEASYNTLELNISDQEEPMDSFQEQGNEPRGSISDNESLKNEESCAHFQLSSLKIQNKNIDDADSIPVSIEPAQMTPLDNHYEGATAVGGLPTSNTTEDESYVPLDYYKMDAVPRGICIVIDNQIFTPDPNDPEAVQGLLNREGSAKDSEKLKNTFERLKFIVHVKTNLKDTEMIQLLRSISGADHSDYNCFICCILSHGGENHVFGVNGKKIQFGHVTSMFRAQSCPSLARKPKLFFLASCRGKDQQIGVEDIDTDTPQLDTSMWIPNESDFLLGYSTVINYVSYRSKSQGTFYIDALTSILDKYAHREDLQTLLIRVNDVVSQRIYQKKDSNGYVIYKQTPAPQHTLRKHLKFL